MQPAAAQSSTLIYAVLVRQLMLVVACTAPGVRNSHACKNKECNWQCVRGLVQGAMVRVYLHWWQPPLQGQVRGPLAAH